MIWRIKEYLRYRRLKKICAGDLVVRKGHWRYFRNKKFTRIPPCLVAKNGK